MQTNLSSFVKHKIRTLPDKIIKSPRKEVNAVEGDPGSIINITEYGRAQSGI